MADKAVVVINSAVVVVTRVVVVGTVVVGTVVVGTVVVGTVVVGDSEVSEVPPQAEIYKSKQTTTPNFLMSASLPHHMGVPPRRILLRIDTFTCLTRSASIHIRTVTTRIYSVHREEKSGLLGKRRIA